MLEIIIIRGEKKSANRQYLFNSFNREVRTVCETPKKYWILKIS